MTSSLTTAQMLDAIRYHSERLAEAARGHFAAPVPSCGSWTVADLVDHVIEVQWSWGTRAILRAPGEEIGDDQQRPPTGLSEIESLAVFGQITERMLGALDGDDEFQRRPVWTWAPDNQTIGFITRHQVQEAAVHHYDAARAAGTGWTIDPVAAADSIEEFLTYSIGSAHYPAPTGTEPLGTPVLLAASDTRDRWLVADGAQPGTLSVTRDAAPSGELVEATAGELLLWLYGRIELDAVPAATVERFRGLTWTD